MADLPIWTSPSKTANKLSHVRQPGGEALGFALFRPKPDLTVAGLAFAKLNPVEPTADSPLTRCGWPTTARDHRLVAAPGTPDPRSLGQLFTDYDAATTERQQLLAAVLTVPFDRDRPLHDSFDQLIGFAAAYVARSLRLTSLAILHVPGDQLGDSQPHGHLLMLARVHTAVGYGRLHPFLTEDAHARWADDWTRFATSWRRLEAA